MSDIIVRIRTDDGKQVEVTLEMSHDVYNRFLEIADRLDRPITDIFGEALRLEQLFDEARKEKDKSLIFRVGDTYQELASV